MDVIKFNQADLSKEAAASASQHHDALTQTLETAVTWAKPGASEEEKAKVVATLNKYASAMYAAGKALAKQGTSPTDMSAVRDQMRNNVRPEQLPFRRALERMGVKGEDLALIMQETGDNLFNYVDSIIGAPKQESASSQVSDSSEVDAVDGEPATIKIKNYAAAVTDFIEALEAGDGIDSPEEIQDLLEEAPNLVSLEDFDLKEAEEEIAEKLQGFKEANHQEKMAMLRSLSKPSQALLAANWDVKQLGEILNNLDKESSEKISAIFDGLGSRGDKPMTESDRQSVFEFKQTLLKELVNFKNKMLYLSNKSDDELAPPPGVKPSVYRGNKQAQYKQGLETAIKGLVGKHSAALREEDVRELKALLDSEVGSAERTENTKGLIQDLFSGKGAMMLTAGISMIGTIGAALGLNKVPVIGTVLSIMTGLVGTAGSLSSMAAFAGGAFSNKQADGGQEKPPAPAKKSA